MKKTILIIALALLATAPGGGADLKSSATTIEKEKLEGITHYGMPIEEISKKYVKDDRVLEIIYSKSRSDDNMDNYVKQFYDEFLSQVELWLYRNELPARSVKIIISNCKFCQVGFCKRKNKKEVQMVSYFDEKAFKSVAYTHGDIIDKEISAGLPRSAVLILLEKK